MSQVRTPQHQVRIFLVLLSTPLNVVLVHYFKIMIESGAKRKEGASVEAPHLDAPKGDTSPTQWDETLRVTTPIDMGALADNFFRVSVGNPQRERSESPIPGTGQEVNELDVRPQQCLYCLQLDVTMVQDPSRPPPPRPSWMVTIIRSMVSTDTPNIKDCVILGPGLAILFFGHHQEP